MRRRRLDRSRRVQHGAPGCLAARRVRPGSLSRLRVRRRHRAPGDAAHRRAGHSALLPERSPVPGAVLMLIKVPLSWLREYVEINVGVDELALKLHMRSEEHTSELQSPCNLV